MSEQKLAYASISLISANCKIERQAVKHQTAKGDPAERELGKNGSIRVWLIMSWLKRCYQRHTQRRELAQLPDHLLDDLGLTHEQRQAEVAKPFWRA